jgi:hypothetical protein
MNLETFFEFFASNNFLSIGIKLFGIIFSLLFLIFSFVVLKQVQVMRKTVVMDHSGILIILAFIQVVICAGLVFYSLFVL